MHTHKPVLKDISSYFIHTSTKVLRHKQVSCISEGLLIQPLTLSVSPKPRRPMQVPFQPAGVASTMTGTNVHGHKARISKLWAQMCLIGHWGRCKPHHCRRVLGGILPQASLPFPLHHGVHNTIHCMSGQIFWLLWTWGRFHGGHVESLCFGELCLVLGACPNLPPAPLRTLGATSHKLALCASWSSHQSLLSLPMCTICCMHAAWIIWLQLLAQGCLENPRGLKSVPINGSRIRSMVVRLRMSKSLWIK